MGKASGPGTLGLRRVLARLLSLLLVLVTTVVPGPGGRADAFSLSLPGRKAVVEQPPGGASGRIRLQEVAPPGAVQQGRESLGERVPVVRIDTPRPDSLIPAGPWSLRLGVQDWPLVDAGPLGLGPHLVVQLDDEAPRRLVTTELEMPALTPGSHRLTVYAAWPWGEAVKSAGAWTQIRLHRVAANPAAVPARGTAQLIPVSPAAEFAQREPVLLDWLLLDAPLQNLRPNDTAWRLRVSVNGDSVLLDRATPLWLKGWRSGSNALQLELVDGRGEAINPPFNSIVSEVQVDAASTGSPWLAGRLAENDLAVLIGTAAPDAETSELKTPEPAESLEPVAGSSPAEPQPPESPGLSELEVVGEPEPLDEQEPGAESAAEAAEEPVQAAEQVGEAEQEGTEPSAPEWRAEQYAESMQPAPQEEELPQEDLEQNVGPAEAEPQKEIPQESGDSVAAATPADPAEPEASGAAVSPAVPAFPAAPQQGSEAAAPAQEPQIATTQMSGSSGPLAALRRRMQR